MTTEKRPTCDVAGILNEQQGSCVVHHVAGLRAVVYHIHLDRALALPYAVNWNGLKQPQKRIAKISSKSAVGEIRVLARAGQEVSLYLGSDASPEFRNTPLYTVQVGVNDIHVDIYTKQGHHDKDDTLRLVRQNIPTDHGDKRDEYEGILTGDIWMRFSHKYTKAEARQYADAAGLAEDAEIVRVLNSIYGGVVGKRAYLIDLGGQKCRLAFQEDADGNASSNIKKGYDFAEECQPRVHPNTWIAVLQAARYAKVTAMELTSGWRPLTGSSAHRLGLGLDIKYVQTSGGKKQAFDMKNTDALYESEEEKEAHQALVQATHAQEAAKKELNAAQAALPHALNDKGRMVAQQRLNKAREDVEATDNANKDARAAFDKVHQQGTLWRFEKALLLNPLVKQLYDPFYVDHNTADNREDNLTQAVGTNRQIDSNEKTHLNHLHITARDLYLLP